MRTRFVVLLAGEVESGLAPLSSPQFPKQFFRLPGEDESLLQQSARAACGLVPAGQVVTVTTAAYAPLVKRQLCGIDPELVSHVLVEPASSGMAAACAVAAHYAMRISGKALLWILPGSHDRRPPLSLRQLREDGFAAAEAGHILAFGARALSPDAGFNWLVADNGGIERFHEKPARQHAQELLDSGRAWWSSGMFVLPAAKLLGYIQHLMPELYIASSEALHRGEMRDKLLWLCPRAMEGMPPHSLGSAIMARASGMKMHPLDAGWSDIGTWPRLLAWWQTHAANIPAWDFGNGAPLHYAEAWEKMRHGQDFLPSGVVKAE